MHGKLEPPFFKTPEEKDKASLQYLDKIIPQLQNV